MISKNKIKFINSLKKKKYREIHRVFFAEGEKLADELIKSNIKITEIFATKNWLDENYNKLQNLKIEITEITENELESISSLTTPNKVFVLAEQPEYDYKSEAIETKLSILLDNISDPGNLGTIIRIADWFGIETIFCTPESVDLYNPKVVQSTMGAICRIKVYYTDFPQLIEEYRGIKDFNVYGTLLDGENIYNENLSQKGFIIMGSESHGISEKIRPLINKKLFIPNFSSGKATSESLNISIATGIVCSEFRRRSDYSK